MTASTLPPILTPRTVTFIVKTAMLTVQRTAETVVTNATGKTLYYLTADTAMKATCTGGCVSVWPPLLVTGTSAFASSLPHMVSILTDPNGQQLEYDGHLLYTFSGDSGPGMATGEGMQSFGGTWHVVTPDL